MISISKAYSMRQLRMEGDSIVEISRKARGFLGYRLQVPRDRGLNLDLPRLR